MKEYMMNPEAYLICERLKQLIAIYGEAKVQDELFCSSSENSQLEIHILNLLQTYPTSVVIELADIIFYEKVG